MERPEIVSELTDIFREVLGDESLMLTPGLSAADVPEWDSFNHINIVVGAEARFGIRFTTADLDELRNVGEFVDLIASKLEKISH